MLRMPSHRAVGASFVLILLSVAVPSAAQAMEYNPMGRIVNIGTTRLHVHCVGDGSPTVVIDTGLGESALEWLPVQQRLRHYTRTCLYDRAGYGWSDFGELPRSSSRIVNELYLLLGRAEIPGPYVLVGHSYGGMNMQLFARRYPYLVSGLVLVDSSSPEQIHRVQVPFLQYMDEIRPSYEGGVWTTDFVAKPMIRTDLVDGPELLAAMMMSRTYTMRTVANEYLNFKASARQVMRNTGRLPDVPVVVLSRGIRQQSQEVEWGGATEDAWMSLQSALARAVPRAAHIVAERSGHAIHAEQPELVIDAATMVVDFARAETGRPESDSSSREAHATSWLPFADATWVSDGLHTTTDVCPFGCDQERLAAIIRRSGHLAGTRRPSWQRVPYGNRLSNL